MDVMQEAIDSVVRFHASNTTLPAGYEDHIRQAVNQVRDAGAWTCKLYGFPFCKAYTYHGVETINRNIVKLIKFYEPSVPVALSESMIASFLSWDGEDMPIIRSYQTLGRCMEKIPDSPDLLCWANYLMREFDDDYFSKEESAAGEDCDVSCAIRLTAGFDSEYNRIDLSRDERLRIAKVLYPRARYVLSDRYKEILLDSVTWKDNLAIRKYLLDVKKKRILTNIKRIIVIFLLVILICYGWKST